MIPLTPAEIAGIVSGRVHDIREPQSTVTGPVVKDSREVRPGSLFVAFGGARVDGHDLLDLLGEGDARAGGLRQGAGRGHHGLLR
ncbi:hypothetical protein LJ221_20895, partial [Streptomyces sp. CNQ085]|nr:hypothetical protein [Streptomyces sp. CNQ085]